jgi:hypothetical protein
MQNQETALVQRANGKEGLISRYPSRLTAILQEKTLDGLTCQEGGLDIMLFRFCHGTKFLRRGFGATSDLSKAGLVSSSGGAIDFKNDYGILRCLCICGTSFVTIGLKQQI